MAKMGKPEMTVVRFRAEDVIATSVAGAHRLVPGTTLDYYTIFGWELVEGKVYNDDLGFPIATAEYNGEKYANWFWLVTVDSAGNFSPQRRTYRLAPYAWYDNGWYTSDRYTGFSLDFPADNSGKTIKDTYPGAVNNPSGTFG